MVSNQLAVILGTLALLGTAAVLVLGALVAGWAALRGKRRLAWSVAGGAAGLVAAYALVLLGAGLLSRDTVTPAGDEKYFCEIDCHVAYRVLGVRAVDQVPEATGRVWAVELRTRFDESTISARRGREAPLWPSPRHVALRDSSGAVYEVFPGTEGWLARQGIVSTPLTRELRPGDAYTTTLLFDLPAAAAPARLVVEDAELISALVIGSERSPWHGKALLPVPAPAM